MSEYTIKNLPDLLKEELEPNQEIVDINIKKLPQNGLGSIMLKVDLKIKSENGSEKTDHVVAKILPSTETIRKMFNIQVTYKKEIGFYNSIVPTLRNFQKENGVTDGLEMFPKFYGARINIDGSDEVTDDAAIILENLVESGYSNLTDRLNGFDFDAAELILSDLAKFQGTAIALKQKQPKIFQEKIKPYCKPFDLHKEEIKKMFVSLKSILEENPKCAPLAKTATSFFEKKSSPPREHYASVTHGDLWINNTMQKFRDGKVMKNVIVDFQICDYRSCAADVFFFLWTSVQKVVLENKLDELIRVYHDILVETIQQLKGDTSAFSLEKFYEEVKLEADFEFGHALLFIFMIKCMPSKGDAVEIPKENESVSANFMAKKIPVSIKEFMWFMTIECNKRGWLY